MKSTLAMSLLALLPSIQAATIPKHQHDEMLQRNFKNVIQDDPSEKLFKRTPQGPASNPGEFTNVGLPNFNPNEDGNTNDGNGFIPEPMLDPNFDPKASSSLPSDAIITPAPSSGDPLFRAPYTFGPPLPGLEPASDRPYYTNPHHTGTRPHHPHRTGDSWSHPHRNHTHIHPSPPEHLLEVDVDVDRSGQVEIEETRWDYNFKNGTWKPTGIMTVTGTIPMPIMTGLYGTGTGSAPMPIETGGDRFMGGPPLGFLGPGLERERGGDDVGMTRGAEESMSILDWLLGWLIGE